MAHLNTVIIIPALNEECVIFAVVSSIRGFVDTVIVVDNGSDDATAQRAKDAGALVVSEPVRGYGRSCLAGVAAAEHADILIFMDGDGADDPNDLKSIMQPITSGQMDFVVGSRLSGIVEKGALTAPQRFGNWLACALMSILWSGRFSDLGPFRAIRRDAYERLRMSAPTFGWTVEMQVRALKQDLKYCEVPVRYRRRVGVSKISGTVSGVIMAGALILGTIAYEVMIDRPYSFRIRCANGFGRKRAKQNRSDKKKSLT